MGLDTTLLVGLPEKLSDKELRTLRWELGKVFGHKSFEIAPERDWHALAPATDYYDLPAAQWYEVGLVTRYWGIGYERGDFVLILVIADWLTAKFPQGVVWYGDDNGVEPWKDCRRELVEHFLKPQEWGYRASGDGPECSYCQVPTDQYAWGPQDKFRCEGCGEEAVVPRQREISS